MSNRNAVSLYLFFMPLLPHTSHDWVHLCLHLIPKGGGGEGEKDEKELEVMAVEENSYRTVTEACARLLTSNILQEKPKWTFWPTQYYLQQLYGGGNIIPILQMSKLRFKDNSSACWRPYKYQSKCQSQVQTQGYLAKKISDPHHSLPMFFLLGKWRDLVRGPQRML